MSDERFIVELGADVAGLSRALRDVPRMLERTAADLSRVAERMTFVPVERVRAQAQAAARAAGDVLTTGAAGGLAEGVRAGARRAAEQLRGPDGRFLTDALRAAAPAVDVRVRPVVDRAALAAIPRTVADALASVQTVTRPTVGGATGGPTRDPRGRFSGGEGLAAGAAASRAAGAAAGRAYAEGFGETARLISGAFEPSGVVGRALALGGAGLGVRALVTASEEATRAQLQLSGTAKLSGLALDGLEQTAAATQRQFRLSLPAAAGFTTELTKLAAKAGDASRAGAGIAAFLDLGAARGFNATATLEAVRQAVLGIDEGTDKLFGKNPSAIYAEFAARIGESAAKLTDAQKAQALLDAAIADGARVRGAYGQFLDTAPGKLESVRQRADALAQRLAAALTPAFLSGADAATKLLDVVAANGPIVTGLAAATAGTYALAKGIAAVEAAAAGGGLARVGRLLASPAGLAIGAAGAAVGTVAYAAGREREREDAPRAAAATAAQAASARDLARYLEQARAQQRALTAQIRAADPAQVDIEGREAVNARRAQLTRELLFVNELVAAYEKRNAAASPTTPPRPAVGTSGAGGSGSDPARAARAALRTVEDQAQAVLRLRRLADDGQDVPGLDARALAVYDALGDSLGRQADQFGEAASRLRAYRAELAEALPLVAMLRGGAGPDGALGAAFAGRVAPRLTPDARALAGVATVPGLRATAPALDIRAPQLGAFGRLTTAASTGLGALRLAAEGVTDALWDAPPAVRVFARTLERGVGGLERIVDAVRRPGDLVARTASGGASALGTVANLAGLAGAAAGVVGALAPVFGGLFGDSPAERERRQLLRQNNDRLADLREELSGFLRSAAGVNAGLGALTRGTRSAAALSGLEAFSRVGLGRVDRARVNGQSVDEFLRGAAGVSFGQLQQLARSQGIELLDSNGRLVAGALAQLREALGVTAERLTRFGVGLEGQRTRAELRDQLFNPAGAGQPGAALARELGLLQRLAPNLGGAFAGLSGDTAEGREAIRQGLRDLFTRIDAGALRLEDLGQLAGLDELLTIIRGTNDALTQMGEAAGAATAALLNVPSGFRVALAAFDASDARPLGGGLPGGGGTMPALPAAPAGPRGTRPTDLGGAAGGVTVQGPVTVVAQPGETTDQAFERWARRKRRDAEFAGFSPEQWTTVAGLAL